MEEQAELVPKIDKDRRGRRLSLHLWKRLGYVKIWLIDDVRRLILHQDKDRREEEG